MRTSKRDPPKPKPVSMYLKSRGGANGRPCRGGVLEPDLSPLPSGERVSFVSGRGVPGCQRDGGRGRAGGAGPAQGAPRDLALAPLLELPLELLQVQPRDVHPVLLRGLGPGQLDVSLPEGDRLAGIHLLVDQREVVEGARVAS